MTDFASRFLETARPALHAGDPEALAERVRRDFKTPEIAGLLRHRCPDVRQVAAVTLGLVGGAGEVCPLARALHDEASPVVRMAEHALWSIWFRLCRDPSCGSFTAGVRLIGEERYDEALEELDEAIDRDPGFAEARNQSAIALYLLERYDESIARCEQTVSLMPCHFGAIAGMGHGHVQRGRLDEALRCYRRARAIHPRLPGMDEHIACLESKGASVSEAVAVQPRDGRAGSGRHFG